MEVGRSHKGVVTITCHQQTWSSIFLRKFKPYVQNGVESKWAEDFTTIITPQTTIPEYVPLQRKNWQATQVEIPKAKGPSPAAAAPASAALVAVPGAAPPPPPPGLQRGKSTNSLHSDDMNTSETCCRKMGIQNRTFDLDIQ